MINGHEDHCALSSRTPECTCRADRVCPICGETCKYDGWDYVHESGLGIGSCG